MSPDSANAVTLSFVCEAGRLEAQALLLAASLRALCPDLELVAALPGDVPEATRQALDRLRVTAVAIANPLAADYPTGNKLAALAAGWNSGLRVFLDSDMLCLRAPDWGALTRRTFAAKPADIATFADNAQWRLLYARFGLPDSGLCVAATASGELMHSYFNAGMLATTQAQALAAVWTDACRAIDGMDDIRPRRPWLDQIGLPLAVARLNLSTRVLDEVWNYPAHIRPLAGRPSLVHYHLPTVVAREPALRICVADLLERYPELRPVMAVDAAWEPVLGALNGVGKQRAARLRHATVRTGPTDAGRASRASDAATGADLIVTGIPRSGTSYLCRLLDSLDNMAVVNEPLAVLDGLQRTPTPWAVALTHADLRRRIDAGEAVENRVGAGGRMIDDTALADTRSRWRAHVAHTPWVLATKNTLAYLARLEGICSLMPQLRVVACVRHPLDTLASWKATFAHLACANPRDVPVGGLADPFLPASLRRGLEQLATLPTPARRRAAWWRLLAGEILALGARIQIVRYEDLVASPDPTLARALGPLAACAGHPVEPFAPSAARHAGRASLDAADREAVAMLCADVAGAFGYDCIDGTVASQRPTARVTSAVGNSSGACTAPSCVDGRAGDDGEPRHELVGRPDLWPMKRAFQIDFLRTQGLQSGHRLVDIGCGSLRGGAALIAYLEPGRYTGIDVREEVLTQARHELRREKLLAKRPELVLVEDMAALDLHRRFDVLWAFSVLFHLSGPILDACFAMAARHLAPDGVFFANVILGDGPPGRWQGFPVIARSLDAYHTVARRHGLHVRSLGSLAQLGHHSGERSQDEQWMLAIGRSTDAALR